MTAAAYTSQANQGWGASQTCAYCHGFANIPPLIRGSDGRVHLNPDFEMIKRFHLAADPLGGTIPAGGSADFTLTVPPEGSSLGDMLVNELLVLTDPAGSRNVTFEILNLQTDRLFQNAPIFNTLIMGNAHLSCCLPCCFLIQATNSTTIRVQNNETFAVSVSIVARGKRFLPKDDEVRFRMLSYWNQIPSYPYFLTLDQQEILVPAGGSPVVATMSVPGTGDFEVKWPRCEVLPSGAGTVTANDILVSVSDGVGRSWQSDPLPLGAFVATPTLQVTGFPGDLFRAASACHCPPYSQLFKRNNRIRHTFVNPTGTDAIVRLTYAGCFHKVDECPPGRSIDRIRSLEPTIGPILVPSNDYCAPAEYYPEEEYFAETPGTLEPTYQQPAPAPQAMEARDSAGNVYRVVPGGPLSYMQKYYQPGQSGQAQAQAQAAAAHGLGPQHQYGWSPIMNGLGGRAPVLRPGQAYFDPISRTWKRV